MKTRITCIMILLICVFLAGVAAASADTIVITYLSGKVQTVTLDEQMEDVKEIGYRRNPVAMPEATTKQVPGKQPDSEKGTQNEQLPGTKKPGVTIKWAPPIDE